MNGYVNDLSLVHKSGEYAPQHHAYDNFRHLVFRTTTLGRIVQLRKKAGCLVEYSPDGILRLGPGDGSSGQLSKDRITATFSLVHAGALKELATTFEGSDKVAVRRVIDAYKEVSGGSFVPVRGRILVYRKSSEFGDQPAGEFQMEVDQARSNWNIPIDEATLRDLKLPAGTTVNDGENQRSFVVGETSVPRNLDKLAERATEVLYGSIEPKPEPYNWYLLGGGVAALLLLIAVGYYLRRRGRYA